MSVYLDNAATSWPKPPAVYAAMDHYQRNVGAAAGRATYRQAIQAQQTVTAARAGCARLLGIAHPTQLVWTHNGTDALNLAIHGLLRPGDHVVTTVCEHNSVLRPLHHHTLRGVQCTYVDCDQDGYIQPAAVAQALRPHTRLAIVNHASNVTGALQPLAEIAQVTREHPAWLLVDACQTAGCVPLPVADLDLVATGGHKGLLGPLGTGLLYIRPGLERELTPLRHGGTGTHSQVASQPAEMPTRFESGNLNVPALAGLVAAIDYLEQRTVAAVADHIATCTSQLWHGLAAVPGLRLWGPPPTQPRVGVVSCSLEGYDPQEVACGLEAAGGIACRAGLHCAPRQHQALGTAAQGGLVRFSPGWATTAQEIDQTVAAMTALAGHSLPSC